MENQEIQNTDENQQIETSEESSDKTISITIEVNSEEAMEKLKLLEETIDRIRQKQDDLNNGFKVTG